MGEKTRPPGWKKIDSANRDLDVTSPDPIQQPSAEPTGDRTRPDGPEGAQSLLERPPTDTQPNQTAAVPGLAGGAGGRMVDRGFRFHPDQMPTMHRNAFSYINDVLIDLSRREPELLASEEVQEAQRRLEALQDRIAQLPTYTSISESYARTMTHILDALRAAGYENTIDRPSTFLDPGKNELKDLGPEYGVKSDMTYERNYEMATTLEGFFERYVTWYADEPERPTRPVSPAGSDERVAEEEAYRSAKRARKEWNDRFDSEVEAGIVGAEIQTSPQEVFVIDGVLGRGGMGIAFEAHHKLSGEVVVLKSSSAFRYNDQFLKDFPRIQIRESMALHTMMRSHEVDVEQAILQKEPIPPLRVARYIESKQILHPGDRDEYEERTTKQEGMAEEFRQRIKDTHMRSTDRYAVLVMEKIEGPAFNELIAAKRKEQGMIPDDVDNYSQQLLEATSWMHYHGVYHRDLKPSNIVLDAKSNTLRVIDFGGAIMPYQVERQAVRIKAAQRIQRRNGSEAPIYAREPGMPVITLTYAPDEELTNPYYLDYGFAQDINDMEPEQQHEAVKRHAARRDNYATGRMIYDMLISLDADEASQDDRRMKQLRYIASKLQVQNAQLSTRWQEGEYFTLRNAMALLEDNAPDVDTLPDHDQMLSEGRRIYEGKAEIVRQVLEDAKRFS